LCCVCILFSMLFDEGLFKCQHYYLLVSCSVINVSKVVKSRKGSMPLALAMVIIPFPIGILPYNLVPLLISAFLCVTALPFCCPRRRSTSVVWLNLRHILFVPSYIWKICTFHHSFVYIYIYKRLYYGVFMQGLFVTIWHHSQLSTFSCNGNRTYFRISCGNKIAMS
jgi:hypothetical protein